MYSWARVYKAYKEDQGNVEKLRTFPNNIYSGLYVSVTERFYGLRYAPFLNSKLTEAARAVSLAKSYLEDQGT